MGWLTASLLTALALAACGDDPAGSAASPPAETPAMTLTTLPLPPGSATLGLRAEGVGRVTATYDVPIAAVMEFERHELVALGWTDRTLHAPTGTSAGGARRADYVRGATSLQLAAVPLPDPVRDFSGFDVRLTVIVAAGPA